MPLTPTNIPDDQKHEFVMHPKSTVTYGVDFGASYLENGVTITNASVTLSAAATSAGLIVDQTTQDDTFPLFQVSVETASQEDATFENPGTEFAYLWTLELSNGDTYNESWAFTVSVK